MRAAQSILLGVVWLAAACVAGCAGGVARMDGGAAAEAKAEAAQATRLVILVGAGLDARMLAAARAAASREGRALAMDELPVRIALPSSPKGAAPQSAHPELPLANLSPACGASVFAPPALAGRARARGLAVGIVTTTRLTGPVPASLYAPASASSAACAGDENALAALLVPGGPGYNPALGPDGLDLALGGGRLHFLPSALGGKREDGRRLTDELAARGVRMIENIAGFRALDADPPQRLFGLFAWDGISDEADRDVSAEPSLAQMTVKAMALLGRNARGNLLLVESGQIDALRRAGDGMRATVETGALDDALRSAMSVAVQDDPAWTHTLIVLLGEDFAGAIGAHAEAIAVARDRAELNEAIRRAAAW